MTFRLTAVQGLVNRFLVPCALILCALPAFASLSVKTSKNGTVDIAIVDEPLSSAVASLQPYLARRVDLLLGNDPDLTYKASHIAPEAALAAIATAANVELVDEQGRLWIRDAKEPTVTLDVKDAEARDILKSLQTQCRVKNLMIDPQVQGTGTFLFHEVPCRTAWDVVLRTLGLSSTFYGNSVVAVNSRSR